MSFIKKTYHALSFDTFGGISLSSFIICVISGIAVAVPYDVSRPYDTVSDMMLSNPPAAFFRNLHYWSAQFFLIFALLHVYDHLKRKTEYDQGAGLWLVLSLSLVPLFFVMLSGFILKGDPDAILARQIFSSLLETIPFIGSGLNISLMGSGKSLQLIYIHHVATATILLFVVVYEHIDRFWPETFRFLITLFSLILFSYFFSAPLHDGLDPVVKGPWYFVGLQEILHWMGNPGWIWVAFLAFFLILVVLRKVDVLFNKRLKQILVLVAAFYFFSGIIGYFFRGENWEWDPGVKSPMFYNFSPLTISTQETLGFTGSIPTILDRKEGCMVCHGRTTGFSPSHDPEAIGCFSCHGGNPFTLSKARAHRAMIIVPGNLDDSFNSCGNAKCHPGIPERVSKSIMSTLTGMVTVNRFVFGESDTLDAYHHIINIGHTAADEHLRDLCAHCHIGHEKKEPGPLNQLSRGGGCNACHLNYTLQSDKALTAYLEDPVSAMADTFYHSSLNLNISNDHCFGCHSRSGRISTNYEGWHETRLDEIPDDDPDGQYRKLEDERIFRYVADDVHHRAGIACVDCHLVKEIMGDGNIYLHKEKQVRIRCEDCHRTGEIKSRLWDQLDDESRKIARIRGWDQPGRNFAETKNGEDLLVGSFISEPGAFMLDLRFKDTMLLMLPPAKECTRGSVHDRLSCQSCHSAWAPQCIGCHNTWEKEANGYDLLARKEKEGSWVEFVGSYLAEQPVLGVIEEPGEMSRVHTFVPGMIMTIDRNSYTGTGEENRFLRLYAPTSAHTTMAKGHACKDCHLNPLVIGFGRGELVLDKEAAEWTFIPRFARNTNDGLPEDAWTGFLEGREDQAATRYHMRPFNREEQKRILNAGACLYCHEEDSEVMQQSLFGIESLLNKISDSCVVPIKD